MTREEIINGLKMSMDLTLFDPSTGEVMEPRQLNDINRTAYEAYKGAIELLEKQPDTTTHDSIPAETGKNDGDGTSGDCISRQAAIDALKTDMASLDHIIKGMSAYDVRLDAYVSQRNQVGYDIDTISNLPPAQPERKTGHWILDRSGRYCCSKCMEPCATYAMMKPRDKFCKMCGVKMDGGEQDG